MKRACSEWGQLSPSAARKSTPDFDSTFASWQQGCILPSGSLTRFPDFNAWEWLYQWEHLFGSASVDGSGEGSIIPVTPIQSKEIEVNGGIRLVFQCTQSWEIILFITVFECVLLSNDCLDPRRFVLGMGICGVNFYLRDGHALRLTSACGSASTSGTRVAEARLVLLS